MSAVPTQEPLAGPFGYALTVDVEEWYHTCHVPEYVDPGRRPALVEELDRLLPELLELLARAGRTATCFVLGEVARRRPQRVREIAAAGHEVASHGDLHLRAGGRSAAAFRADAARSKALLEDTVGAPVRGYRAPEWSLRRADNPRLAVLAEVGYAYDSSLAPYLGAGTPTNPRHPVRLAWPDGRQLLEFPPLTFGAGLRLPASGWTGRLAPPAWIVRAALSCRRQGGLPVLTVHPWELAQRATPGELTGLGRFLHEAGRWEYRGRFEAILGALPWRSLRDACRAGEADAADAVTAAPAEEAVAAVAP